MEKHRWNDIQWQEVTPEISRKIITGANVMVAHVRLRKGSVVPEHSHVSEQITSILDGSLQFWIEGREIVVGRGEVLVIPPHVPHKAVALEDTLDVDVFSPIRQDWLDGSDTYFRKK